MEWRLSPQISAVRKYISQFSENQFQPECWPEPRRRGQCGRRARQISEEPGVAGPRRIPRVAVSPCSTSPALARLLRRQAECPLPSPASPFLPPSHHPSSPSLHLLPEEVTDGPVIWFHSLDWSNTCPPPLGCEGLIPNHESSQRQIWAHMQIRQHRGSSAACSSATRHILPTDQEHQSPLEVPTTKNHEF